MTDRPDPDIANTKPASALAPSASTDTVFPRPIAARIRKFRGLPKISPSELARRSGIAKGTLSKLEAGEGNPTILTLGALARVLHVTPGDFIDADVIPESPDGPVAELQGPGIQMTFIRRATGDTTWNIYDCVVPPMSEPLVSPTHPGKEHLMVLSGRLRAGPVEAPSILEPGEHLVIDGRTPHMYEALDAPCRMLLMMNYAQQEDVPEQLNPEIHPDAQPEMPK